MHKVENHPWWPPGPVSIEYWACSYGSSGPVQWQNHTFDPHDLTIVLKHCAWVYIVSIFKGTMPKVVWTAGRYALGSPQPQQDYQCNKNMLTAACIVIIGYRGLVDSQQADHPTFASGQGGGAIIYEAYSTHFFIRKSIFDLSLGFLKFYTVFSLKIP